jgi:nitrate reductase NapE component
MDRRLLAGQVPPPAGQDDPNGVRRLYLLAFALVGLVMVTWGAVALLQLLMQFFTEVLWRSPLAHSSAQLLVGAAIWVGHWLRLQQLFASGDPAEERSALRKFYLYLAVFVFSLMAVGSATLLLKRLIELALGAPPADESLLSQLSDAVPAMLVGGVLWAYHWYVLRQDASQAPEAPRQAGVRRLYAYLVATVGLAVLLTGVGGLLSIVIDLLTTPAEVGLAYYRDQVALFTAMTVVGGPVWLLPWRKMQQLALLPSGETERRSIVRKIYLYLYIFIAAIAIFGSVGWFVFQILTAILGADLPDDFITLVLDALVIALLAAGVWLYHWWAIRQDGQLEQADLARRLSDILVVVIDSDEGQLGQRVIYHLQHDLPGLQPHAISLTRQAGAAMAAEPFSAADRQLVEKAHYLIGPGQSLLAGEAAPAVAASPARKLAIPTPHPNWIWAGVKPRSMDYYAHQAARGVKQAIEGEDVSPTQEMDLVTILAIIGGGLLFLFIAGGLVGVALATL